jgi:hypothetical protein
MIEILESRIAPAAVFFYTDVDGNHVKVTSTKGTTAELTTAVEAGLTNFGSGQPAVGKPHQLGVLTLGADFAGASISITATPSTDLDAVGTTTKLGDGFVNVGEINAAGIDLVSVSIHGDLGQIIAGSGAGKTPGLVSLNVESMGDFGTSTGANATLSRFINGVTSITIAHDANGVLLRAERANSMSSVATAKIGSVIIGGNLIGGSVANTGEIAAADGIGSVKIMGSVIGGSAADTGRIDTNSGGNIGSIKIGGDLVGGSATATGVIFTPANIGSVTIKGSVLGGSAITTGGIDGANIGSVAIGGDLTGTAFSGTTDVDHTAFVRVQNNIKSVLVGGSLIPGAETGGGTLTFSAAIQAGETLGAVTVLGSIQGTTAQTVVISGAGLAKPTKLTQDPAINSVTVGGSATFAEIEAGYSLGGNPSNGDAQIGAVKIGGEMIASDIIAGVKVKTAGTDFGTATDTTIDAPINPPVLMDGILSMIKSIVVGGQIEGTGVMGESFGIEAQLIGSITTGGLKLPLKAGSGNDDFFLSATTGKDVHVREFPGT